MPSPSSLSSLNHLLFVGGGHMASAALGGLVQAGGLDPARVMVLDPSQDARSRLLNQFGVGVAALPSELPPQFRRPDMTLLAVKPQAFPSVAQGLLVGGVDTTSTLHVSVMAGVTVSNLQRSLGARDDRVVRAMPNTPASVGEGMTAMYASPAMSPEHRALASALMGAVGQTTWVAEEHLIDAATALSGSGPGYLVEMASALVDAGVELGLTREQARQMVAQTLKGTGVWMAASPEKSLSSMADEVTSPGGTTRAARDTLQSQGVQDALRAGVHAAYVRSMELGGSVPSAATVMGKASAVQSRPRQDFGPAH